MPMLCGNEDVLLEAAKLGSQARTEDGNGILILQQLHLRTDPLTFNFLYV